MRCDAELLKQAEVLAVERRPEACLGCGFEHSCSLHGCAVIRALVETVRENEKKLAAYEAIGMDPDDMKEAQALAQIDFSLIAKEISGAIDLLSKPGKEGNGPLTNEQLHEMDGLPAYLKFSGGNGEYVLLDVLGCGENDIYLTHRNGISSPIRFAFECGGNLYRRKPEEDRNETDIV